MHTAAAAAPTGWLICNGAAVSRTTYAALFAEIGTTHGAGNGTTTFNLPDLRGEFIRGLDLSRGVDAARSLGSAQSDAVEMHSHYLPTETAAGPDFWAFKDNANTPNGITTTSARNSLPATPGGSFYTLDDTETHPSLGPETRPRNVALTPIIKT
jgi:microcystin-dependent protein